ncbi:hypothetical protein [Lysobacter enzymogenes]|uniref:hypothetical protein n=1 Tax=Lysobacter enzymogenes TaxID=69 RepID=UPI0011174899|nr:hypothetical protein [Lysobacter enzymogenes]UZW60550.1 hypothetical protein BV903_025430 [Lysobacter enzymogenes]
MSAATMAACGFGDLSDGVRAFLRQCAMFGSPRLDARQNRRARYAHRARCGCRRGLYAASRGGGEAAAADDIRCGASVSS